MSTSLAVITLPVLLLFKEESNAFVTPPSSFGVTWCHHHRHHQRQQEFNNLLNSCREKRRTTERTKRILLQGVSFINEGDGSGSPQISPEEDAALQWDLFNKHHAVDGGEWWGSWTTYDYMGDVVDTTIGGVGLQPIKTKDSGDDVDNVDSVTHTHRIVTSSTTSDCETCFSSSQVTTMPTIATYTSDNLSRRHRCAAVGMVVGPSLLPRSGMMSTELTLRHGDGRVRVTFQHAPVWERGVEPGSCPPQGLKLFRAIVSKEKLRLTSTTDAEEDTITEGTVLGPPTAQEEQQNPPEPGNPRFFRPVPPFKWHAKWSGTSWTWGPSTGDRGWSIEQMDEVDSWHGRHMGDDPGTWSLRLPGGVLIQCPRVVIGGVAGLCRLAWLPEDEGAEGTPEDGNRAKLLRLEASVMALEPIISDDDENMMVGFYPPSLGSLRCDVMVKMGDLEGETLEERERAAAGFVWGAKDDNGVDTEPTSQAKSTKKKASPSKDRELSKKIAQDPRNALDF